MSIALYSGSFDPIHLGHLDIIYRASTIFDELIVGIGINDSKNTLFTIEERIKFIKQVTYKLRNVKVVTYSGLTIDYACENNIDVIIKGIRNSSDFEYEKMLHQVGNSQIPNIDTLVMFASSQLSHISSSAVKVLQKEQGIISDYVPLVVKQAFEQKLSEQFFIGLTGTIGCGKSYIGKKLEELGVTHGIQVHNIELDHIAHEVLGTSLLPIDLVTRQTISKEFNIPLEGDTSINRKVLGEIVFGNNKIERLNEIMDQPMMIKLRRNIHGKKGIIILNSALLAESNMLKMCNNNVVLLNVDLSTQYARLKLRNLNVGQMDKRLISQYNFEKKRDAIVKSIDEYQYGTLLIFDNSNMKDFAIGEVFKEIIKIRDK